MNDEVNDTFDDLDAVMASKKRGREAALAEKDAMDAADAEDKVRAIGICALAWTPLTVCLRFCRKIGVITDVAGAICQRRVTFAPSSRDIDGGKRVATLIQVLVMGHGTTLSNR
jgi:phage FluMu protein gp41